MQFRRKIVSLLLALAAGAALASVTDTGGATAAPATTAPATTAPATHTAAAPASAYPTPAYGNSYYMADAAGVVWPLGGAPDYGSLLGHILSRPVVGITVTPDKRGYWMVASDGGVFSFGDAAFHGSTGGIRLNQPIAGMAATPDGKGYWLYAADGGIFAFGDAAFYGSTGGIRLDQPIVGMAATPDGRGYWLVASDGGVFGYGDAGFYGSLAGSGRTVQQVVADRSGGGYWEVDHEGDVFPFGAAASDRVPTVAFVHSVLGPGDRAMEWAMAQIGRPYLWGGTGPTAFDCSGLVMRAWESAGVAGIPRVAADQYDFGSHVAIADLRMGDLVYWATNPADPSTIEHVAMYIGGEHMVNAPYTGQLVRTDWIGGSGFVGLGSRP